MSTSFRRSRARRTPVRGAAAFGLLALLFTGCTSAVEQSEGGDAAATTCEDGGTLVMANSAGPEPGRVFTGSAGNITWVREVFEPLIYVDQEKPDDLQPLLASDWEFSDEGRTMVLQLRDDVTFHSGRPFTADDVIFTFEAATEPASPSNVKNIIGSWQLEATGEHEVTITSETPIESIAGAVLNQTPIVDSESYEGVEDGSQLIGTGPMTVESYEPGASLTVVANENYWEPDLPRLDKIESIVIADSTALLSALRSGRAQFAAGLTTTDAQTIADGQQFELGETTSLFYPIGFDVSAPPLDNKQVRQAIGYAIDRERINEQIFGGTGNTDGLFWPEGTEMRPEDLANSYTYDPERARQMIEEAGATGAKVRIVILNIPRLQAEYEIIANNLAAVGLDPTVEALAVPDFQSRQAQGAIKPAYLSLRAQGGFPAQLQVQTNPDLFAQAHPTGYSNPEYTALVEELVNAEGAEEEQALHELTEFMLDEAFIHLLVTAPSLAVQSTDLQGLIGAQQSLMLREACLTP